MTRFPRFEYLLLPAIGAVFATQPALAQRGAEVTVEVGECLEIEAATERLACFERRVEQARDEDAAPATPARGAATPPAAPAPPAARTAPAEPTQRAPAARAPSPADDDSFGRRISRREEREARELEPRIELVATVVSLRETIPNSYTITLDNGQVWRQNRPEYYPLQPGHEVRIYPGKMGNSYRLTAPVLRGWIQVERVR